MSDTPLHSWKLLVRYDGGRYQGWQRLGPDAGGATIQGKIEGVISSLCEGETLVTGSGRTDAGVHALAQAAHFRTPAELTPEEILAHSNRYLPDDIAITHAEPADERFHARYKVREKHYLYRIDTGRWPEPFERKYSWHLPDPLDFSSMRKASELLVGSHDFTAFTSMKSKKKSAARNLMSITISEATDDSIATLRLVADGFLHNMVRIIVGTLVDVGQGTRKAAELKSLIENGSRADAGPRAPAKGLFLEKVVY